ncbi:hypothetical protein L596_007248 [Steinernema carpocapsae]|nr:hypothetical protein L596_007248 [Steinernema carpocapsae]
MEAFISAMTALVSAINMVQLFQNKESFFSTDFMLFFCLFLVAIFYGVASFLMVIGIHTTHLKLMYPTLVARAVLVVFVQVFGVSIIVKPRPEVRQKGTDLSYQSQMNDTPITLRLIFLLFVMIFVSIGILYTIYLVVRCMRYVTSFRKLLDRRHSFITAGQIGTSFDVAFL